MPCNRPARPPHRGAWSARRAGHPRGCRRQTPRRRLPRPSGPPTRSAPRRSETSGGTGSRFAGAGRWLQRARRARLLLPQVLAAAHAQEARLWPAPQVDDDLQRRALVRRAVNPPTQRAPVRRAACVAGRPTSWPAAACRTSSRDARRGWFTSGSRMSGGSTWAHAGPSARTESVAWGCARRTTARMGEH